MSEKKACGILTSLNSKLDANETILLRRSLGTPLSRCDLNAYIAAYTMTGTRSRELREYEFLFTTLFCSFGKKRDSEKLTEGTPFSKVLGMYLYNDKNSSPSTKKDVEMLLQMRLDPMGRFSQRFASTCKRLTSNGANLSNINWNSLFYDLKNWNEDDTIQRRWVNDLILKNDIDTNNNTTTENQED